MTHLLKTIVALAAWSAATAFAQAWPAAQHLAESTLAHHPEAAHVVLHVTPPGAADSENLVIGSTIGHLGKKADDDDLRIMHEARTETVVAKAGDRFNVSLPLYDSQGRMIGIVAIGFPFKAGDDKAPLVAAAERIRDELRNEVVDVKDLFAGALPASAAGTLDPGLPNYEMHMPAAGALTGVGDPGMKPLMELWLAAFRSRQPGVARGVPWNFAGESLAIGSLMFETADVALLGRPFQAAESAPYAHQFAGDMMKTPLLVQVAGDAGHPVYVAVNKRPGSPLPRRISEFLSFALSRDGQQIVARQTVWTPLSAAQAQEQRRKLDGYVALIDLDLRPYAPVRGISGAIRSVGSDGMKTLMDRWMRDFEKLQPYARKGERWEHLGTLNGFHALIGGQTDLAPMGRELWPEERAVYESVQGHPVFEIRVARGGFDTPQRTTAQAIFVSNDNPLDHITVAQVAGIFAEPPTITRWGQLGLTGEWADRPVQIHMPPHVAPNAMWMQAEVLKGAPWRQGAIEAPIADTARALAADAQGIGFGGFEEGGPGLHALAVAADADSLYIEGNPVSASNGKYPLTRYMYIRLNRRPDEPLPPVIKQFLRYVLSRDGQEPILYSGYFPLGARVVRGELAKLE